jgi:hypothetical protein
VNNSDINLASSLAANGSSGPETLAIGTNSSAFEEVPPANCSVDADERGDPRPGVLGKDCDAGAFEYQPVPTVSAVSPDSGPTTGDTAITITGTGFNQGAVVKIAQGAGAGPTAITASDVDVVSSTKITAVTGGSAKAGTWNLFVITAGGTSAVSAGDDYTYESVPTVSSVSPDSGPTAGGTPITISGTNFIAGATVKIAQGDGAGTGAVSATDVTVVSSTKITASTGAGKAGAWNLFVITAGGTSAVNAGDHYTYQSES